MKPEKTTNPKGPGEHRAARPQRENEPPARGLAVNDEWYEPTLSETFNDEIDAWARHAMARSGFG